MTTTRTLIYVAVPMKLLRWLLPLLLVNACGGDTPALPDDAAIDSGATDATSDAADTNADATGECVVHVALSGLDAPTCGKTSPCHTITRGLANAQPGCTVLVDPGTYDAASGETFPLDVTAGIHLKGAGSDKTGAPTIVSEPVAGITGVHTIACSVGGGAVMRGTITMTGAATKLSKLIVRGAEGTPASVAVLVVDGTAEIFDASSEYGGEGIYTGGTSVVSIHGMHVSHAGHAGIKPAGNSQVTVDSSTIFQNKDAVEPICSAVTTVKNSEVYCNGNGLEALVNAVTTLTNNTIHHNTIGMAARGDKTSFIARDNKVRDNKFGAIEIVGKMDLGTKALPGNNKFTNNQYVGVYLSRSPTDLQAIGNEWLPNVDGASSSGLYSGAVSFAPPKCPNTPFGSVENPPDPKCVGNEVVVQTSYQNVAIDDGSCASGPVSPTGNVIVSVP